MGSTMIPEQHALVKFQEELNELCIRLERPTPPQGEQQ